MNPSRSSSRDGSRLSRFGRPVLWLAVLIAGLMSGCGKKADPIPLRLAVPQVISDLRADSRGETIVLSWTAAISEGSFRILRSERFPDEETCADCPRNFVVAGEQAVELSPIIHEGSSRSFSWNDNSVKEGNSYSYRVVVCSGSGICGEPSNIVDIRK